MCGIHGIINFDGRPADATLLERMGAATVHRGPDDQGIHVDGPCAIGMRRLSIIDLSGGHQPLRTADNGLWLVCNGEIYNYRELRQTLESRGHRFLTHSDSETILHAYAEYGDDFVEHLNGMFAFALWDAKRRRLILGRDRLGIKPVYLLRDGTRLAFASEAKALLTLPGVSARIDPAALDCYLQLGYVTGTQSMFAGITRLPPASLLVIENGHVEQRTFWRIPQTTDHAISEAEWIDQTRGQIDRSVRMQMVSDVQIGAFLSGGVDSSAVVACMARGSGRPIKTYSIGFGGSAANEYYNELPYARRIATLFGTDHKEILVQPDVISLLPSLLWHMDEPIADTAFITTYLVSQFARQDVKVILSGVGGDELFGGYRRYLGNHYAGRFARLPALLRRGAIKAGTFLPSDRHSGLFNAMRLAKGFLSTAELSFEDRYQSYVRVFDRDLVSRLLRAPMPSCESDAMQGAFAMSSGEDSLNRMLTVDAATQLPDDLLMLTDKMTMATSLECRVPLLDHDLVELAARMPERIKIRGGQLKYVMKQALAGLLPPDILHRGKRGFGAPMGAWLKKELAPLLDQVLSERAIDERGLFDFHTVREIIDAHASNREDYTDQLLSLLNLEIWARVFLDGRSPADVSAELKTRTSAAAL